LGFQPVFKVRGFQVSGDELEALIRNHPDVDEVCVLGVPDPYSGEVPVALVVLGDEAKERAEKRDSEVKKITISILKARSVTVQPTHWTIN
jgi:4-coumarate--CoA ligase